MCLYVFVNRDNNLQKKNKTKTKLIKKHEKLKLNELLN